MGFSKDLLKTVVTPAPSQAGAWGFLKPGLRYPRWNTGGIVDAPERGDRINHSLRQKCRAL